MRLTKICARHLTGIRGIFFICATLGRLRWSLWKGEVASILSNVRIVSKSHAEFPLPSALLCNCALTLLSLFSKSGP